MLSFTASSSVYISLTASLHVLILLFPSLLTICHCLRMCIARTSAYYPFVGQIECVCVYVHSLLIHHYCFVSECVFVFLSVSRPVCLSVSGKSMQVTVCIACDCCSCSCLRSCSQSCILGRVSRRRGGVREKGNGS